jgi:large subunit ribosomal protein L35
MPKMRSNRGASKRFSLTGTKKVRRNKAYTNHILTKKSTKRKRNLRKPGLVSSSEERRVKRMLTVG